MTSWSRSKRRCSPDSLITAAAYVTGFPGAALLCRKRAEAKQYADPGRERAGPSAWLLLLARA